MDRAKKMDSRANGEVTFTGATTEFQLKKGLTHTGEPPIATKLINPKRLEEDRWLFDIILWGGNRIHNLIYSRLKSNHNFLESPFWISSGITFSPSLPFLPTTPPHPTILENHLI
jgi:hypothetical protein